MANCRGEDCARTSHFGRLFSTSPAQYLRWVSRRRRRRRRNVGMMATNEESGPSEDLNFLSHFCAVRMSYWGQTVSDPESLRWSPGSAVEAHLERSEAGGPEADLEVVRLAWRSLAAACEHAGAGYVLHEATHKGVIPFPQLSLARAAMLGSARTIYLLEPEDPNERLVNAARLTNKEVRDSRGLYKKAKAQARAEDGAELAAIDRALASLESVAQEVLRSAGFNPASTITETDLLDRVSHHLEAGMPDSSIGVHFAWRYGSGAAHARNWVWGSGGMLSGNPTEQFAVIWSVPLGLTGVAWELWNIRRGLNEPQVLPPINFRASIDPWLPPVAHDLVTHNLRRAADAARAFPRTTIRPLYRLIRRTTRGGLGPLARRWND